MPRHRLLVSVAVCALLVLVAVALTVLHPHRAHAVALKSGRAAAARVEPAGSGVLERIVSTPTRTCSRSRVPGTPASSAQCLAWLASGPVNVVLEDPSRDPVDAVAEVWAPARGHWLVAQADLEALSGCGGWTDSGPQFELRLTQVGRRHAKLVPADCAFPGMRAYVADVHTDQYDYRRCGGDYMVDVDAARDAFVASLATIPGTHVTWVQARPAGITFVGGCGNLVRSDGRVAVVTLD